MKRFLFFLLLIFALLGPLASAQAQTPVPLKSLTISLWPEFDQPNLLVIIDGELETPGQSVEAPVPAGALINAVAELDATNDLLNTPYQTRSDDAGNQIVTLTPAGTHFRVEYYLPLSSNGATRVLNFVLPAGYFSAAAGRVEVLLPPSAANLVADPALTSAGFSPTGGAIFQRAFSNLAGIATLPQNLTYDNASGALTLTEDAQQPAAPAEIPSPAAGEEKDNNALLIGGLVVAALLLGAGGGYGLWRLRQPAPTLTTSQRRRRPQTHSSPAAQPGRGSEPGQDRFCRQCGAAFSEGDRFCRSCGGPRG